jgi:hypothetical protein
MLPIVEVPLYQTAVCGLIVKTKADLDKQVQIAVLPDEDLQLQSLTDYNMVVSQLHDTPNICNYKSPPVL